VDIFPAENFLGSGFGQFGTAQISFRSFFGHESSIADEPGAVIHRPESQSTPVVYR
jgi:hypothetical protein